MKLTLPSVEEIPISDRGVFAKRRIKQLIVDAGAMRVSKNAITMLNNILFEKGIILAKRSIRFAKHAKRKTIKEEDIIMANQ
ncbi:MAG: histone [Candidatus Hodarchaeales archaeon]